MRTFRYLRVGEFAAAADAELLAGLCVSYAGGPCEENSQAANETHISDDGAVAKMGHPGLEAVEHLR